jgi:WD40 repeat protein
MRRRRHGQQTRGHDEGDLIHSVAASAAGRVLAAGSGDGAILLRLTDTGARLEPLHGHTKRVKALAFSADGNLLASGGEDCSVRLWHVATGRELLCFNDLPHQVNSVAFAPDGFTLAAAVHDGTIHLWRGLEPAHSDDAK